MQARLCALSTLHWAAQGGGALVSDVVGRYAAGDTTRDGFSFRPDTRRTKKPRRSGARFHRVGLPLATTANPPTPYHSRLHSARGRVHNKSPARREASGAKSTMRGRPEENARKRQPQRYNTTETVAQHSQHSVRQARIAAFPAAAASPLIATSLHTPMAVPPASHPRTGEARTCSVRPS
jgi:hypothetical protein